MDNDNSLTDAELLLKYGSRSKEYHRRYQRQYRATKHRIDYVPSPRIFDGLESAIRGHYALSYGDAIEQALTAWLRNLPE